MIACEKVNRKCRMIELDPQYIDAIIKRWEEFTGKNAIHASNKQSFEDGEMPAHSMFLPVCLFDNIVDGCAFIGFEKLLDHCLFNQLWRWFSCGIISGDL
jgi:hypothetical protein